MQDAEGLMGHSVCVTDQRGSAISYRAVLLTQGAYNILTSIQTDGNDGSAIRVQ